MDIVEAPTITSLPAEARGAVVVSGSHGGRYPGYLAAKARVRAVILNDAGVGRDGAGIGALGYLERYGIAAAAISHASARIGDAADMTARGIVSHANAPAQAAGVAPGMACREAATRLLGTQLVETEPDPFGETRSALDAPGATRRVVLVDSAAQLEPGDAGQIIVTGSHGGLVGGDPRLALRVAGYAGVFNDAGIGIDEAGITRLPALDQRGIAAFTVSAASACIGDAGSSYRDGVISVANKMAQARGAQPGLRARDVIDMWTWPGATAPFGVDDRGQTPGRKPEVLRRP
ncbi:MAG TPA: hypothetical protein VGQ90_08620 [Stellaceae bacterium]|jgi:hypothetical protein|nr:hypothetical protein [Stellaceae bacterium]